MWADRVSLQLNLYHAGRDVKFQSRLLQTDLSVVDALRDMGYMSISPDTRTIKNPLTVDSSSERPSLSTHDLHDEVSCYEL